LYEAKRNQHPAVHAFPSSIDASHFGKARKMSSDPEDQAHIPHPRLGFFGVIDERFDIELLDQIARQRPDWHFIMIGPVVKIDPAALPSYANIHYLGGKKYSELPDYLAGWDIALLLFAHNESTRYISPTKTPEYLAAGKPTISTSIRDVVRPYGDLKLVEIADTADEFVAAAEKLLAKTDRSEWLKRVDAFLENISWDKTWAQMSDLIDEVIEKRRPARSTSLPISGASQRAGAGAST
jgi:UDP-galactopyranose mutase